MTRLDEIRARLEKATPGPWSLRTGDGEGEFIVQAIGPVDDYVLLDACPDNDADFIAHSRADLEWAVARIEELEREAECFEEQLEDEIANARMGEDL